MGDPTTGSDGRGGSQDMIDRLQARQVSARRNSRKHPDRNENIWTNPFTSYVHSRLTFHLPITPAVLVVECHHQHPGRSSNSKPLASEKNVSVSPLPPFLDSLLMNGEQDSCSTLSHRHRRTESRLHLRNSSYLVSGLVLDHSKYPKVKVCPPPQALVI